MSAEFEKEQIFAEISRCEDLKMESLREYTSHDMRIKGLYMLLEKIEAEEKPKITGEEF